MSAHHPARAGDPTLPLGGLSSAAATARTFSAGIVRRASPDALLVRSAGDVYTYVCTSDRIDRMHDRILPAGVDFSSWRPPVVLFSHDPARPIGRGSNPTRIHQPVDGWQIDIQLASPGKVAAADEARALIELGALGVSIGFRGESRQPTAAERKAGVRGVVYTKSSIVECSLVACPANVDAQRVKSLVRRGLVSRETAEKLEGAWGASGSSGVLADPLRERLLARLREYLG